MWDGRSRSEANSPGGVSGRHIHRSGKLELRGAQLGGASATLRTLPESRASRAQHGILKGEPTIIPFATDVSVYVRGAQDVRPCRLGGQRYQKSLHQSAIARCRDAVKTRRVQFGLTSPVTCEIASHKCIVGVAVKL